MFRRSVQTLKTIHNRTINIHSAAMSNKTTIISLGKKRADLEARKLHQKYIGMGQYCSFLMSCWGAGYDSIPLVALGVS